MVAERGGRCVIRHPRVATPRVSIFYRCIARRALHNENGLSPKRNLRGFGFPPGLCTIWHSRTHALARESVTWRTVRCNLEASQASPKGRTTLIMQNAPRSVPCDTLAR